MATSAVLVRGANHLSLKGDLNLRLLCPMLAADTIKSLSEMSDWEWVHLLPHLNV